MYLELLIEARSLMEKAVAEAGYSSPDMYLGESVHADVSSALPFRLGKELRKNPAQISKDIVSKMGTSEHIGKVKPPARTSIFTLTRSTWPSLWAIS
jgi:arginyl-tRNA synthetase